MKITQITLDEVLEEVRKDPVDPSLYRICLCDDGNYGKQHRIARIKPVKNIIVGELVPDPSHAYVRIEAGDGQ